MNIVAASRHTCDRVVDLTGRLFFRRQQLLNHHLDSPVGSNLIDATSHVVRDVRVRFRGRKLNVRIRRGTTDADLVGMILRGDEMYRLPPSVQPGVIFDVGANIGVSALYFALTYPNAHIYCFEPLPDNLELLRHNTAPFQDRIHVVPYGLSDRSGKFEYHMSDNPLSFGGGSFHRVGHDPQRKLILPVAAVSQAMAGLGVQQVDLFKIDTEGAEWSILRSIPDAIRAGAQAFLGELHGVDDWQCCNLLDRTHAIGVHKDFTRRCFPFTAIRKDLVMDSAADSLSAA